MLSFSDFIWSHPRVMFSDDIVFIFIFIFPTPMADVLFLRFVHFVCAWSDLLFFFNVFPLLMLFQFEACRVVVIVVVVQRTIII